MTAPCLSDAFIYMFIHYYRQDFAGEHAAELGMQLVPSANLVFTEEAGYILADDAKAQGLKAVKLSGTEFRRRLRAGEDIPEWFAFKSVVQARLDRRRGVRGDAGAA